MLPWKAGIPVVWDVTVTRTAASSYIDCSTHEADAAAEIASTSKYSNLSSQQTFYPTAVETRVHWTKTNVLNDRGRQM